MTLKSILIDGNRTKAMKLGDDKVQVDIVALPVDEENDVELSVKVGLYINWQLFDNLESDLDGYIKKTLVVPHTNEQYITLKLEDLTKWIQSKIKNILILGSQEWQEEKEDMDRLKEEIINLKNQINDLWNIKKKEIESASELEKSEVLSLVSRNWMNLWNEKCKKYSDDDEIVKAAINQNWLALKHASENLRWDKNICLDAVKQNWLALEFVSNNLRKNDLPICLAAINQDIFAAKFIPKNIINNEEILKILFLYWLNDTYDFYNNTCFGYVDAGLRSMMNEYYVFRFVETRYEFVKENKDFVLSLMKKNKDKISDIFNSMGKILRDDKDIMIFLITKNVSYFKNIWKELSKDEGFILSIIKEHWIEQIEKYLTEDMRELPWVGKITNEHKENIEKKLLEKKKNVALKKARENWSIDEGLANDKEIVIEAIKKDISIFQQIGEELSKDEEFILCIIEENWIEQIEKYLTEEVKKLPWIKKIVDEYEKKQSEERKDKALQVARTKWTFEKEFNDDKDVVLEALRKNIDSFKNIGELLVQNESFIIACIEEFWYVKIKNYTPVFSKKLSRVNKIIEENEEMIIDLDTLREKKKEVESLLKQKELLSNQIDSLSNLKNQCLNFKLDVVRYQQIGEEWDLLTKLMSKTHMQEQHEEYLKKDKSLWIEKSNIKDSCNKLQRFLVDIDIVLKSISPDLRLWWNSPMWISLIEKEIKSSFKLLSWYITNLDEALKIVEWRIRGIDNNLPDVSSMYKKIKKLELKLWFF